ncbi:MAG: DUF3160 domain-containing protein [Patescibacteria group bacterium]
MYLSKKFFLLAVVLLILVSGGSILSSYLKHEDAREGSSVTAEATDENITKPAPLSIPKAQASNFATYKPTSTNVKPLVKEYKVEKDLTNVTNRTQFELSDAQKALVEKNDFVIAEGFGQDEFYPIYERNRYGYAPSFVTTDSVLHTYHVFYDYLLKRVEEDHLHSALKELTANLLSTSDKYATQLKGTGWENAATRNAGFFGVAARLLDSNAALPSTAPTSAIIADLESISAHERADGYSAVMQLGNQNSTMEDFTQYVPRGHYDKTDLLKTYFKTMMWYGRLTFLVKNPEEVRSAVLITLAMQDEKNAKLWNTIYEPTKFFVGESDDITYIDFFNLINKHYKSFDILKVAGNDAVFSAFVSDAKKLAPPQINSIPILAPSVDPNSNREESIKGFRFMGQRFTLDASIFQRLICREVGTKSGSMKCGGNVPESRMLPKALDIPAAMGSDAALELLTNMGETEYKLYPEQIQVMRDYTSKIRVEHWTQNLYWSWLYALQPLTLERDYGYPSFMRSTAWQWKNLNTYLSSWTELKHDTVLYAKQAYSELGGGPPDELDDRGYVEPEPEVFARLASLALFTKEGLQIRGLISSAFAENLTRLETLSRRLKSIAEKELNGAQISKEDYEFIRTFGGSLEHFWLEANREEMKKAGIDQINYLDQNPAALVSDVATDPNGTVLQEATGDILSIYVVVPVEGKLRLAKGGVYSHYEFIHPAKDRLTDTTWREILNKRYENQSSVPAVDKWLQSISAQ